MGKKKISHEQIINAFLCCSFEKSAGSTSLQDIADYLGIKKASLYNHFTSKEEMYVSAVDYCRISLDSVNFISEEERKNDKIYLLDIKTAFRKLLKRYVQIYESDPIFQVYCFVNSEKYFFARAAKIVDGEVFKVKSGIIELLRGFEKKGEIKLPENDILRELAANFTLSFMQQLDTYIVKKKEIARQNPDCSVGSLFVLPTDEEALEAIVNHADFYLDLLEYN